MVCIHKALLSGAGLRGREGRNLGEKGVRRSTWEVGKKRVCKFCNIVLNYATEKVQRDQNPLAKRWELGVT